MDKNIYTKVFEGIKSTDKLEKTKDGYKFKYIDPNQILQAVQSALDKNGILLIMSMSKKEHEWSPEPYKCTFRSAAETGGKQGEYESHIIWDFTFIDKDSKEAEKIVIQWPGSGVGAQPGQADGASSSYAIRQMLEKNFKITTEKDIDEENENEVRYTNDVDGEAVDRINTKEFEKIKNLMFKALPKEATQNDMVALKASILNAMNSKLKPSQEWKSIQAIPSKYFEELEKVVSLKVNA